MFSQHDKIGTKWIALGAALTTRRVGNILKMQANFHDKNGWVQRMTMFFFSFSASLMNTLNTGDCKSKIHTTKSKTPK